MENKISIKPETEKYMTDYHIYDEKHNLDGTISQLLDWAYRYDVDFSDEQLDAIHDHAERLGLPKEKSLIPILVKKARKRTLQELPYELMKLEKLHNGIISFSRSTNENEIEITEDGDKILVAIYTRDGIASNACDLSTFMNGDDDFLNRFVNETYFYGFIDEKEESES